MPVHTHREGYLASAIKASATGSALDLRAAAPYGYLFYIVTGQSAIWDLDVSHDQASWVNVLRTTATAGTTAFAQFSGGYYPYLRANVTDIASGANKTGTVWVYYAAGIVGGG